MARNGLQVDLAGLPRPGSCPLYLYCSSATRVIRAVVYCYIVISTKEKNMTSSVLSDL